MNEVIIIDTNPQKNTTPLYKKLKKVLLILPFMMSVIFITACGIPKYTYDTNVKFSNVVKLNIVGAIESLLVDDNPDHSSTSYDKQMQGKPDDPTTKSPLLETKFCSDYKNSTSDALKSITYPTVNHNNKYTYYFQKIIGLYVKPTEVLEPDDFLMVNPPEIFATDFPAPQAPYDHDALAQFDYGQIWQEVTSRIYSGILEVQGKNEFKPHITDQIVYIRFLILFDKSNNAIDIFLAPTNAWIEK